MFTLNQMNRNGLVCILLAVGRIAVETDHNHADILCNAPMIFQIIDNLFCFWFSFEILGNFRVPLCLLRLLHFGFGICIVRLIDGINRFINGMNRLLISFIGLSMVG